jgi:hypothetical protein
MTLPLEPATKGKTQRSSTSLFDIDTTADTETPPWLRCFGIKSLAPDSSMNMVENSDWDDVDEDSGLSYTSQVPLSKGWSVVITFSDKDYGTATFQQDPGQAALEAADGELVHVRWYKRNGSGKIREGWAWCDFKETDNGGVLNATATLTGDGKLDKEIDASTIFTP